MGKVAIQMAIKPIRTGDDPVLKQKAKEVSKFDDRMERLINNMLDTMYDAGGIGLAAPQIGILKRVIVVDNREEEGEEEGHLYKLINPEIVETSREEETSIEGCLSFPGVQGEVTRPKEITVKACDINGEEIEIKADGLLARVIQHEVDHLEGEVLVNKAEKLYRSEGTADHV